MTTKTTTPASLTASLAEFLGELLLITADAFASLLGILALRTGQRGALLAALGRAYKGAVWASWVRLQGRVTLWRHERCSYLAASLDAQLEHRGWGLFYDVDSLRPCWPWMGRQGDSMVIQAGGWELVRDRAPRWLPGASA